MGGDGQARLLEVDVGTDQHVAEQEDPALLGLDQLPAVTVHGLRQRLTQEQLPLARGQKLGEETGRGQRQHRHGLVCRHHCVRYPGWSFHAQRGL